MNWIDWKPFYDEIVAELDLDVKQDRQATRILTGLLEDKDPTLLLERLDRTVRDRVVIVCGAGPSLDGHLTRLMGDDSLEGAVFIVADGAASALLERGLKCDVLVTDLDGEPESIERCTREGAITVVHGHGHNIDKIEEMVPRLGEVLGSTQVEPTHRSFLWGGFTDGDRACYLAAHYAPKEMILAGMDLGDTVGRWSKPNHDEHFPATERKRAKLRIAEKLLLHLFSTGRVRYRMME